MKKIGLFFFLICFCINVDASGEATLKNIKVNNKACECLEYVCEVEVNSNSVTITYDLVDSEATVDRQSGITTDLSSDVTTIKINVDNGENHNIYEFIITKHIESDDYSLSELLLNEEAITLMDAVYVYNAKVDFDCEEIVVEATPTSDKAKVDAKLTFEFPVDESSKSIDFEVEAENGDKKNYRIVVTRKAKPDTSLKSLAISEGEFQFDKDTYEYEISVDYTITNILVEAIANDSEATVKVLKEDLEVGDNTITIEVTNGNAQSTYTIKVYRNPNLDKSLANLASLKILEYPDLDFDPNVLEYKIKLEEIKESLTITAKADSSDGLVEILGNEDLEEGSIIKVKVTLKETGITREYTLTIEGVGDSSNKILIIVISIVLVLVIIILIFLEIYFKKKRRKSIVTKIKEEIEII